MPHDDSQDNFHKTYYWHRLDDGRVCCDLCPQHCTLREGKRGNCYVRMCHQGEISLVSYGRSSGFAIDPIEKKPLYHFYPGSQVLSFGTAGCNLSRDFCQNWRISKSREMATLSCWASPEEIVANAKRYGCQSIAFTYNDPVIFMEYAVDVSRYAQSQGLKSVVVSAGYICAQPRVEFFKYIDAANIDLKGFTESFYKKHCHGSLQPVLETLQYLKKETPVWFELTNLLIPDENDSDQEIHNMCAWIVANLGVDIPLHFTAFHPDFKMLNKDKTGMATLLRARDIAMSYGMHYVYCGNVNDIETNSTYCFKCHQPLIIRDRFMITANRLSDNNRCPFCGTACAINA
ncbi:AmmeMemoRadiSam system radical SAM enzyme [Psychromonas sp. MME2]|uniref:AmmeMemoRadiSam system radical SAM enzyme n=1 Tax=Psychromonas sp. MME2 TaxID=3231033 RepID=UPI00339CDF54